MTDSDPGCPTGAKVPADPERVATLTSCISLAAALDPFLAAAARPEDIRKTEAIRVLLKRWIEDQSKALWRSTEPGASVDIERLASAWRQSIESRAEVRIILNKELGDA